MVRQSVGRFAIKCNAMKFKAVQCMVAQSAGGEGKCWNMCNALVKYVVQAICAICIVQVYIVQCNVGQLNLLVVKQSVGTCASAGWGGECPSMCLPYMMMRIISGC